MHLIYSHFFSYLTIFQPFIQIMTVGDKKKLSEKYAAKMNCINMPKKKEEIS